MLTNQEVKVDNFSSSEIIGPVEESYQGFRRDEFGAGVDVQLLPK